ncbi:SHOCT domain-containing protein [Flavobacteriaceae bacterium]|nr:SHOCT domain-containing protein [Flavobacteriaceae bacterium]
MNKLLLILLFIPVISFGQLTSKKIEKMKAKTEFNSSQIKRGASVFIGVFKTKRRAFDKSNIGSHIKKNLMECGLTVTSKKENADYIIEADYVTDAIAKKQILGLWLSIADSQGNNVLNWQFERKMGGIILKPQEIGEFLKYIIKNNLSDSVKLLKGSPSQLTQPSQNKETSTKQKAIEELKELKGLLDLGLISQEEFEMKASELKKIILE